MQQPNWSGNILVFYKQGDQDIEFGGYRHGEPVSYIDPEEWMANHGSVPILSDNNMDTVAYACLLLPRSELQNVQDALATNAENRKIESGNPRKDETDELIVDEKIQMDRVLLDTTLPVFDAVREDWLAKDVRVAPIELSAAQCAAITKQVTPPKIKILDNNAWTSGNKTIGSAGADYLLRSTCFADMGNATGDMSVTQITDITDSAFVLGINLGAYNFTDDGGRYTTTAGTVVTFYNVSPTIGGGTITIKNIILKASQINVEEILVYPAGTTGTINLYNSILKTVVLAYGQEMISDYHRVRSSSNFNVYNTIIDTIGCVYGWISYCPSSVAVFENCIFRGGHGGFYFNGGGPVFRNCHWMTFEGGYYFHGTGATAINCGIDLTSIPLGTVTNPQNNVVATNEFVSVDITNANAFKVKAGGQLATNGVATGIAGNTVGFYGNPRPGVDGVYSIGIDEISTAVVLDTAAFNSSLFRVTATGSGFGATRGTGKLEVSLTGLGVWTEVLDYISWADDTAVGHFTVLGAGTYDAKLTNADGSYAIIIDDFSVRRGAAIIVFLENQKKDMIT